MLDPEFPHIVLLTRDYFVSRDVDLLRLLREAYLKNKVEGFFFFFVSIEWFDYKGSSIPWKEVVRLRVLNVMKLFADNYLPDLGICQLEFAELWKLFVKEMEGEQR